jgi:hypothetical protein
MSDKEYSLFKKVFHPWNGDHLDFITTMRHLSSLPVCITRIFVHWLAMIGTEMPSTSSALSNRISTMMTDLF